MKTSLKFMVLFLIFSIISLRNLWSQWMQQQFPSNEGLYKIRFVTETTGWVLGSNFIYKTSDGGINWEPQDSTFGGAWGYALSSKDENIAFYVSYNSNNKPKTQGIRRTIDGGITWETVDSKECYYTEIKFVSNQVGFAAGSDTDANAFIQKTTDGGATWSVIANNFSPSQYEITGISFIDEQVGWAISYDGYVFQTTDGGQQWSFLDSIRVSSITTVPFHPIRDIEFVTADSGWAIGGISGVMVIARTTNGGKDWTNPDATGSSLQEVTFLNNKLGWICGQNNSYPFIAMTTDGGVSWQDQTPPRDLSIRGFQSISIINKTTGWAVGVISSSTPAIFKMGDPVSVDPSQRDVVTLPDQIVLEQNYPNPFNLATQINYTVGVPSHVSLKIYNLNGKEIKTLTNGYQEPGYKSAIWDGKNNLGRTVPSGIYLYKIESGSAIAARKMSLVK